MRKLITNITMLILTVMIAISTTSCGREERVAYNVPTDFVLFIQEREQYGLLDDANIVRNEDSTLTLMLTDKEVQQFKTEFRANCDQVIEEIVNGDKKIATIKGITYNDDFSEVVIEIDAANSIGIEDAMGLIIGNYSVEEQVIFGGVPYDQVKVNIKTVDSETGEVISEQQFLELKEKYYK